MTVFNKGTWKGGITSKPRNGQFPHPPEIGDILKWKNLQKILKKNQTSLNKNQIRPHFNLLWTKREWCPWKVLSRTTSRVQTNNNVNHNKNKIVLINTENFSLNQNKIKSIIEKLLILIVIGHQLLFTKCDVCQDKKETNVE